MDEKRMALRRKIHILQDDLREGLEATLAATYLQEIVEAERELRSHDDMTELGHCQSALVAWHGKTFRARPPAQPL